MCCDDCGGCGLTVANFMYTSQKLVSCCAVTAIAGTLVLTLIAMLAVGIGLGYHYCVVETKTYKLDFEEFKNKYNKLINTEDQKPEGSGRSDLRLFEDLQSPQETHEEGPLPQEIRRAANGMVDPEESLASTLVVPIGENRDFSKILAKIKGRNRNFTLQFVV